MAPIYFFNFQTFDITPSRFITFQCFLKSGIVSFCASRFAAVRCVTRGRIATDRATPGSRQLDRYVRPELGARRVNQLETRDIQKLYSSMQSQKSLSARIVRHTHAVLRQVLEQAVEWKLILRNPADSLKRKLQKYRKRNVAC